MVVTLLGMVSEASELYRNAELPMAVTPVPMVNVLIGLLENA